MSKTKIILAMTAATFLGACASGVSTRNAPLEDIPTSNVTSIGIKSTQSIAWRVQAVRVNVPDTLSVTEANLYLPPTDIVWREDPYGDRRAQVRTIIETAISQAALGLDGGEPVYIDVELKRFHALSQKARATVGGRHAIEFDVTIKDVATELALVEPFTISIKLKAFGGQKAIDAEIRGDTQKVRITREITRVMQTYLGV